MFTQAGITHAEGHMQVQSTKNHHRYISKRTKLNRPRMQAHTTGYGTEGVSAPESQQPTETESQRSREPERQRQATQSRMQAGSRQARTQAARQPGRQGAREAGMQASKQASKQVRHAGRQAGKQASINSQQASQQASQRDRDTGDKEIETQETDRQAEALGVQKATEKLLPQIEFAIFVLFTELQQIILERVVGFLMQAQIGPAGARVRTR